MGVYRMLRASQKDFSLDDVSQMLEISLSVDFVFFFC
jgi:hypothetical protein